jgi:hypothetical protein
VPGRARTGALSLSLSRSQALAPAARMGFLLSVADDSLGASREGGQGTCSFQLAGVVTTSRRTPSTPRARARATARARARATVRARARALARSQALAPAARMGLLLSVADDSVVRPAWRGQGTCSFQLAGVVTTSRRTPSTPRARERATARARARATVGARARARARVCIAAGPHVAHRTHGHVSPAFTTAAEPLGAAPVRSAGRGCTGGGTMGSDPYSGGR